MWAHRPGLCRGRGPEDRKKADCAEQTVSPLTWGWEEGDMQREADALGEGRRDLATAAGTHPECGNTQYPHAHQRERAGVYQF